MAKRPKILDVLSRIDHGVADEAIVAGALYIEPELQCAAVDLLLARAHSPGLEGLAQLYDKLEEAPRHRIISHAAQLFATLRTTVRNPDVQTRLNTLQIIRESGILRLAYLVSLAMHDGAAKVRAEAAATLLTLTERHDQTYIETTSALREGGDCDPALSKSIVATLQMLREERQYLLTALRDSLENYESHHRPEILAAAMSHAPELESSLFKNSALKRGKLTHAMLELLGDLTNAASEPADHRAAHYVPFIYIALRYPEMRRRVLSLLSTIRDTEFFAEFIRQGWLARDSNNRRHLVAVRSLAWLGDGFEPAFTLPPDVAPMLPGWLVAFGIPSDQKVAILKNLLLIDNADANRAAVWALVKINTPAATLALQAATEHESPAVRRLAQFEVAHRRRAEERQLHNARKDRPPEWAQLLERSGIKESFDDLWCHFEGLPPAQAQLAGHFAPDFVEGLILGIQNKLLDPQAADRLRAVRFVTALRITERFRKELFILANDSVAEVRAGTMKALACIGDPTSRRILDRGLADASPAVQAAAIEALDGIGALKNSDSLLAKTTSDDAQLRAAAIVALLKMHVPQSAIALVTMLQDSRVEHRCTALWIIDQLRLSAVASRVKELADHDKDPRVARTAQQVLRRLERRPPTVRAPQPQEVAT